MLAQFLQFAMSGLTVGAVYGIVALGFTLIYNASGVMNFAQGEFVMIGGMVTVSAVGAGVPLPLAALIAVIVAASVGVLLQRLAIEPVRDAPPVVLIIITVGAALVIRGVAQIVFGKQLHKLSDFSGDTPLAFLGASILPQALWVLAGTVLIVALVWLFLNLTMLGKALIATSANRLAAKLVGINISFILALAFALSAVIGSAAGILVTPITFTYAEVGTLLALKGFAALVLGGLGSPLGAVIGGLLLGLSEAFAAGYLSSTYKDAVALLLMIAVLLLRPGGILGHAGAERV
ncbi:MAG: branched-chain amino acid ABC transporter permease [Hyphomicrobiales bacterium]|nr:branched-chain amino acid ABC transporter permease [Hyphomicrobiales bacterium]OQW83907.1 MAG: branched-chain amino acid ABC transporter permease [Proteobacteria bacterium ST_bin15]